MLFRSQVLYWLGVTSVFPVFMLVYGGFLSYGAAATIVVLSVLVIAARSLMRVVVIVVLIIYFGLSAFSTYFEFRPQLREVVWSDASLERRVTVISNIFEKTRTFDVTDPVVLFGIDQRLNHNFFVGMAVKRFEDGQQQYLAGSTIWQGVINLVPRAKIGRAHV